MDAAGQLRYAPHRPTASEYESRYQGRFDFIFLPPYSSELNPEENMWTWLKDYCAQDSAYAVGKELPHRIRKLFVYACNTSSNVRRRVDARSCFKAHQFHIGVAYASLPPQHKVMKESDAIPCL